jgi:hypothetical protein
MGVHVGDGLRVLASWAATREHETTRTGWQLRHAKRKSEEVGAAKFLAGLAGPFRNRPPAGAARESERAGRMRAFLHIFV